MSWADLIPTSLGVVAGPLLLIAAAMVLLDPPGGVNWSAIGAWLAVVGGFGIVGATGVLTGKIVHGRDAVLTFSQRWINTLIGAGAFGLLVVLAIVGIWLYKHLTTKGYEAGGKSKWAKRSRSLLKTAGFAVAGALVAALIPGLYDVINWGFGSLGHGLRNAVA